MTLTITGLYALIGIICGLTLIFRYEVLPEELKNREKQTIMICMTVVPVINILLLLFLIYNEHKQYVANGYSFTKII